jgi:hypothetical protein
MKHPNGKMSLEDHRDLGRRIKVLLGSVPRGLAAKRLDRVRCDLDSWLSEEYDAYEVGADRGWTSIYYGRDWSPKRTAQEDLEDIGRIQDILRRAYPDCACLRKMLDDWAHVARNVLADDENTDWYSTVLLDTVMKTLNIPNDKRNGLQRYLNGWGPRRLKYLIKHPTLHEFVRRVLDIAKETA